MRRQDGSLKGGRDVFLRHHEVAKKLSGELARLRRGRPTYMSKPKSPGKTCGSVAPDRRDYLVKWRFLATSQWCVPNASSDMRATISRA